MRLKMVFTCDLLHFNPEVLQNRKRSSGLRERQGQVCLPQPRAHSPGSSCV